MLKDFALCPALTNRIDEVHIVEYSDGVLRTVCDTWNAIKPFAVSIYCVGKSDIWLDNKAEEIESEYLDIAVLWHHPNTPRYINNQKTPSPNIPLLILQGKTELMKEKQRLKELGYYKQWKN
jgi:hypothetical protein